MFITRRNAFHKAVELWGSVFKDQNQRILEGIARSARTMIEVGCGAQSRVADLLGGKYKVGVEIDRRRIQEAKGRGQFSDLVRADAPHLPFRLGCVDWVVAVAVIEHLLRGDGEAMLKEMEYVSSRFVTIYTHTGELRVTRGPYSEDRWSFKSGWKAEYFEQRGYKVYGISGLRLLHAYNYTKSTGVPKIRIEFILPLILLFQPLVFKRPQFAFEFYAHKYRAAD